MNMRSPYPKWEIVELSVKQQDTTCRDGDLSINCGLVPSCGEHVPPHGMIAMRMTTEDTWINNNNHQIIAN